MDKPKDNLLTQLQASEPYIPDDGFTQALLRTLPKQAPAETAEGQSALQHPLLLAGSVTALGSGIAYWGLSQSTAATQVQQLWATADAQLSVQSLAHPELVALMTAGWLSALIVSGLTLFKST